jgi:hypothetical protein
LQDRVFVFLNANSFLYAPLLRHITHSLRSLSICQALSTYLHSTSVGSDSLVPRSCRAMQATVDALDGGRLRWRARSACPSRRSPLRPGLLASARTSHAEHPLHPASFPARCGSGAGLTRRRRDVARGHADHRADARREDLDRVTARGPWRHRGGSGRRTHGRASRWPHPTSAKVRFGATTPQPQLPEAVRHCAAVCCCRAVAAAAVQAVAARRRRGQTGGPS